MKSADDVVGWCNKYHSRVKRHKADSKCIAIGCLYYRSYGEYPRPLKVSIGDLVKKGGENNGNDGR